MNEIKMTSKERKILLYIAKGCTDNEIASKLKIGYSHLRYTIRQIFTKTNTNNRQKLISWAYKEGYLKC